MGVHDRAVSKSLASWRSRSWLAGSPQARLTMRPRCTAAGGDGVGPADDVLVLVDGKELASFAEQAFDADRRIAGTSWSC